MVGTQNITSYYDILHHPDFRLSELLKKIFNKGDEKEKKLLHELLSIINDQNKQVIELQIEVRKLKDRLALNSQNSSKPPSSDSPFKKKIPIKSESEKT